jgi:ribonuclease Z
MRHFKRAMAAVACSSLLTLGLLPAAAQTALPSSASPSSASQAAADSLKIVMCGTSGPMPVRDRAKPCVEVIAGGKLYLVDVGPESVENLQLWRQPLATARAVFITHLHSDHIGDLGEFNMQSWVAGRPAPLVVVGPPGVDDLAAGLNLAYRHDHIFRNAHHEHDGVKLPIAAGLMTARVEAISARPDSEGVRRKVVWAEGDLKVTAIVVHHDPASPAYAYRFDYRGRSVVISGDTIKWPPLAIAAKGADVLIHEAQNNDMTRTLSGALAGMGQPRMASIFKDTLSYHTSPVEAAEIARAAGVKVLVFYHLTQAGLPFFSPETFTRGIEAAGFADWRLSKDGMTIELPVGSTDIRFGQL